MRRAHPPVQVYLGLGSNEGDRRAHLAAAVEALASAGIEPVRVSPLYASAFVGPGTPLPEFLNAAVEARTRLLPGALLAATQAIEARQGRRAGTHLQSRPLDLDILLYAGWRIARPDLVVPHPRLRSRRFVLEPLRDLECGLVPDLAAHLARLAPLQPVHRLDIAGAWCAVAAA